MVMEAKCCQDAVNGTVTQMFGFFKTILPTLDMRTAIRIIKGLTLIHPSFIHLLDYQLQDPPKPL